MRVEINWGDALATNAALANLLVDDKKRLLCAAAQGACVDHFGAFVADAQMGARQNRDDLSVVEADDTLMFWIVVGDVLMVVLLLLVFCSRCC